MPVQLCAEAKPSPRSPPLEHRPTLVERQELVRIAHVESTETKVVLGLVRNLSIINAVLVVGLVAYAIAIALPTRQIVSLVLTALLSAVPVALPATFTLAAGLSLGRSAAPPDSRPRRRHSVRRTPAAFVQWGSEITLPRRAPRGRTATSNGSSDRSDANLWTTSWCSAKRSCAVC